MTFNMINSYQQPDQEQATHTADIHGTGCNELGMSGSLWSGICCGYFWIIHCQIDVSANQQVLAIERTPGKNRCK